MDKIRVTVDRILDYVFPSLQGRCRYSPRESPLPCCPYPPSPTPHPNPKPKTKNKNPCTALPCAALGMPRHKNYCQRKALATDAHQNRGKKVPRKKPRVHDVVFVSTLSWHSLPVALVTRHAVGLWVAALIAWTGKRGQVSRKRRLQPPNGCPKTEPQQIRWNYPCHD